MRVRNTVQQSGLTTAARPHPPHSRCDTPVTVPRHPRMPASSPSTVSADWRPNPLDGKAPPMSESYNGYCVKCKEKRDFDGEATETNGRRMAKGTCPACGTKMNRILGKA